MSQRFLDLDFQSDFTTSLPGDVTGDSSAREVLGACWSLIDPTPVKDPKLLAWSVGLADLLGIEKPTSKDELQVARVLSGNSVINGMKPYSACYGGHQFGHWAGQLGDGRAITLGEFKDTQNKVWELQLKGAGQTPYSRTADGRAVLRSSLREFLCSEAMHGLGVPTTRALSLVLTGEDVVRDMFYDGRPEREPGAITSRLAPSFLRFGSFQILTARGDYETLRKLADFTISRLFPEIDRASPKVYVNWFNEICLRTARLMVDWQRFGFVHGVMNTDNMSILGLTIDYGPYGWLEGYDPYWTPNTTDASGRRYCYGRQPQIAYWNLQRLAESLIPLFDESSAEASVNSGLQCYAETFNRMFTEAFSRKLGFKAVIGRSDEALITDLLDILQGVETDFTIFFRKLSQVDIATIGDSSKWADLHMIYDAFYNLEAVPPAHQHQFIDWMRRYAKRCLEENFDVSDRVSRMNSVNPKFVLRNYLAQEAIDGLTSGSSVKIDRILSRIQNPFGDEPMDEDICGRRPEWARFKPGCSALSCSS